MRMKHINTAAVIPSQGIGDALLMMIAAHRLLKEGVQVTVYHPVLGELHEWFPGHRFEAPPAHELWKEMFSRYDLIVFQNDNSAKREVLARERLSVFYSSYSETKHGPLSPLDQVFDPCLPMADNVARGIAKVLGSGDLSKDNGIRPAEYLVHQRRKNRVLLHTTSSDEAKNWPQGKFFRLAKQLARRGYEPVVLPVFPTLSALAAYVYESGYVVGNDSLAGHLASNLRIPTLIIADDEKRMRLWRPGWLPGEVVTPPPWVPNVKGLRLRERRWHWFVSPRRVMQTFLASVQ